MFAVRIIVSVSLLTVLAFKVPDLDGILPAAHHQRTVALLAAAALTALLGVVLSAWRWQRVLAVFDTHVPLATLTATYLASLFVGNVLPSTIGGDVLRVTRTARIVGSTETAFASVALERLTGFVALPLIVFAGIAIQPALLDADHALIAPIIGLLTLGLLASILFLAGHPRLAGRFAENANWTRFIGAVHSGIDRLRRSPRRIADILASALLYQTSVVLSVLLIAEAIDLPVPAAAIVAFVPAVAMIQVLPISVSGLGVREGMLVVFLHPLGATHAQAIGLGLLWYASLLIVSALGAPAFATGHRVRSDPASDSVR